MSNAEPPVAAGGTVTQALPIGRQATIGDFSVTVHRSTSKSFTKRGLAKYHAVDGALLRTVELSVMNNFKRPVVLATRVWLKDAQDRRFGVTPACQFATSKAIGQLEQINPGLTRRGKLCFEVPEGAQGLELMFRDGVKSVAFSLQ